MTAIGIALRLREELSHASDAHLEQLVEIAQTYLYKPKPSITLMVLHIQVSMLAHLDVAERYAFALMRAIHPEPTNSVGLLTAVEEQLRRELSEVRELLLQKEARMADLADGQLFNLLETCRDTLEQCRASLRSVWSHQSVIDLGELIQRVTEVVGE